MGEDKRFGLVGSGIMGKGLARNLIGAGFDLAVYDANELSLERAVEMGARPANGVAGLAAAAPTIGTCLPSIESIRAVYDGPDGLIANAQFGSILVDFSTSDPNVTRELAAKAEASSIHMIDAPMLRMEQHAWEGNLVLLVGGANELVAQLTPALEAVSERFIHCGPVGAGHTFKLLNNINGLCMHAMYSETFALAHKLGVDLDKLLEVLRSGMAGSTILEATSRRIITGEDGPVFATDVALKDVSLFARLAEDSMSPSLLADATREIYRLASLAGYGDQDVVNVGVTLRDLATGKKA